jgi:hypothetical protein
VSHHIVFFEDLLDSLQKVVLASLATMALGVRFVMESMVPKGESLPTSCLKLQLLVSDIAIGGARKNTALLEFMTGG